MWCRLTTYKIIIKNKSYKTTIQFYLFKIINSDVFVQIKMYKLFTPS